MRRSEPREPRPAAFIHKGWQQWRRKKAIPLWVLTNGSTFEESGFPEAVYRIQELEVMDWCEYL
jgi:hypothetical protein